MYINKKMSRNSIAKKFNTSHIVIKRLLARNGIIVENYSRENKETKLIDIAKNLKRNCTVEAEFFLELDSLENLDIEKIKVLNDRSKRIVYRNPKEYIDYKDFMRKFYNDKQFNLIYNTWKENKKNKWLSPSIDHKKPLSNGGGNTLDNLQFLTWFENRAKCNMDEEEWSKFKTMTNTYSNYFIRVD